MLRVVLLLGLAFVPGPGSAHRQITHGCVKEAFQPLCPRLLGKWPFNATKFSGTWDVYAGGTRTELMGLCGRYSIEYRGCASNGTRYSINFTAVDPKTKSKIKSEGGAWPLYGEEYGLVYGVFNTKPRRHGEDEFSPVYEAAIISTDYKTNALFLACRPVWEVDRFRRVMYTEMWVRPGTNLTTETYNVLVNFFSSYDVNPRQIRILRNEEECKQHDTKSRAITRKTRKRHRETTTCDPEEELSLLNAP